MKVEKLEDMIEKSKIRQSKLVSDLKNCKSTEFDLVESQQKTEEFNRIYREMILELKKNQTKLSSKLEYIKSTDAKVLMQKLNDC